MAAGIKAGMPDGVQSVANPSITGLVVLDSEGNDISGGGAAGGEVELIDGSGNPYTNLNPHPSELFDAAGDPYDDTNPFPVQQAATDKDVDDITTYPARAAGATLSNVAYSDTVVDLLAANANRRGAMVQNDTDRTLYLKLGAAATASSYTVALGPKDANGVGDYYELPYPVYVGLITGIWAAGGAGAARVTELT